MLARILKQSLSRQPRRKSLAALAVVAGMAVATAMLSLRLNLGDDLNQELRQVGANIVLRPAADSLPVSLNGVDLRPADSGALLREADLPKLKTTFWTNNIMDFVPVLFTQVQSGGSRAGLEGAYIYHAVTVPGSGRVVYTGLQRLDSSWRVTGAWPDDDKNEVLAGTTLAHRLGLSAIPASVTLQGATGAPMPVTVTGIVASGGPEDDEWVGPLAMAQKLAGKPGAMREVLVSAMTKPEDAFARRNPASMTPAEQEVWSCSPYARTIASQLQGAMPDASASILRPVAESEGFILSKLQLLILLITVVALLASALAIAGAMTAAVLERRGEIALMKAVGAQDTAVGGLFLGEAALLGIGGGALGYVAGEFLAAAISYQVIGHAADWKPALAPLILLLGAMVALVGSFVPLRRAMRIDPAIALRGSAQ